VPVIVATVFVVVLVVVAPPPSTTTPVVVAVAVCITIVPVQVAPIGQHATFLAWSVVHIEPATQQAPASAAANVEQEL